MKIPSTVCAKPIHKLLNSLSSAIYPSFCIQCNSKLKSAADLFCDDCTSLIEWVDMEVSCKLCARPKESRVRDICRKCTKKKRVIQPHCSLFSSFSPMAELVGQFEKRPFKRMAAALASFFLMRLLELDWNFPDIIIPIGEPYCALGGVKQDGIAQIAKELGSLSAAKVILPFCIHHDCLLKKRAKPLVGKQVLLIQLHLWETERLVRAKREIRKLFTQNIYSLSLIEHRS